MTASSAASTAGAPAAATPAGHAGESPSPGARAKARFRDRLSPARAAPGEPALAALRRRRPDEPDERGPVAGGPLSHQSCRPPDAMVGEAATARVEAPARVSQVADRILSGVDATGRPSVRIELNLGAWAGVDVDLVAGARGLELNVFAATAAARRTVQAQLAELADALAQRGLYARKMEVSVRRRDNRGGSRQDDGR